MNTNGTSNGHYKPKEKIVLPENELLYDDEAERAVLGSLMIDADCYGYVSPIVDIDDFYLQRHKWIFEEVIAIIEGGEQPDFMTVSDRLNRRSREPDSGWDIYLMELIQVVPTSQNAPGYAKIVQDYAIRRRMLLASTTLATCAYNMAKPTDESLSDAEQTVMRLRGTRADQGVKTASSLGRYYLDRLETLREQRREIIGLPSGFVDLDRLLKGFESQFYLLAGRPGMGKSSLALKVLLNVVLRQKKRAMLFSLEMNESQLMNRCVAIEARIPLEDVKNPARLNDQSLARVYDAVGRISESQLFIDATPGLTPSQIRAKALRRSIESGGLDLVVIDHIHIMRADIPNQNETATLTSISKDVAMLPKFLGCPVLVLAQLSRSLEQRANKRPQLSDLRQSGSLEEDAFAVMFLYRDDYYNGDMSERPNIAELEVAKNRDGATGKVELFWNGPLADFSNLRRGTDE